MVSSAVTEKVEGDRVKVIALGSAGISEALAVPVEAAIKQQLKGRNARLKTVRIVPSTKSRILGTPKFEVLANTTIEFPQSGQGKAGGRMEVIESIVTIDEDGDRQHVASVTIPGFSGTASAD